MYPRLVFIWDEVHASASQADASFLKCLSLDSSLGLLNQISPKNEAFFIHFGETTLYIPF